VSTEEQGRNGAGLAAQRRAIEQECARRGWELARTIEDAGHSGKSLKRPGIQEAIDLLANSEAEALVAAKLDRLSRSMLDFAMLAERARNQGWALVALDSAADMTTPQGRAVAGLAAVFAELERELIAERTRAAIAEKQKQGVRFGRRSELPAQVRRRIKRARSRGNTLQAIADRLNRDGVPTGQGGREWRSSSVAAVLRTCT
jgi:DNA invertase Pin-like site-specific DNA recombinase